MSKLNFKFDKERDALNFWQLCNYECSWKDEKTDLNSNYIRAFKGKSFLDSKREILENLERLHVSPYIEFFRESLDKSWKSINDEYFNRLEKITNKQISLENFDAYITTVGRCAYYEDNSFTVSLKRPLLQAVRTCGHELFHIHVDNSYGNRLRGLLGDDKFNFLNESLTVLLNLEFRDLWFATKKWKKERDFEKLLKKCIEYLKQR